MSASNEFPDRGIQPIKKSPRRRDNLCNIPRLQAFWRQRSCRRERLSDFSKLEGRRSSHQQPLSSCLHTSREFVLTRIPKIRRLPHVHCSSNRRSTPVFQDPRTSPRDSATLSRAPLPSSYVPMHYLTTSRFSSEVTTTLVSSAY